MNGGIIFVFINIGTHQWSLNFLVVFFHTPRPLLELLKLLFEVSFVVWRDKADIHCFLFFEPELWGNSPPANFIENNGTEKLHNYKNRVKKKETPQGIDLIQEINPCLCLALILC